MEYPPGNHWNGIYIYIYIQVEGIPLYPYISRISHSWIIMEYLGKIQVKSNQKWAEQSAFEIVTDDFPSDQKTLHFGRGFPSHETWFPAARDAVNKMGPWVLGAWSFAKKTRWVATRHPCWLMITLWLCQNRYWSHGPVEIVDLPIENDDFT